MKLLIFNGFIRAFVSVVMVLTLWLFGGTDTVAGLTVFYLVADSLLSRLHIVRMSVKELESRGGKS